MVRAQRRKKLERDEIRDRPGSRLCWPLGATAGNLDYVSWAMNDTC